jgi:hypothetical protein
LQSASKFYHDIVSEAFVLKTNQQRVRESPGKSERVT